MKSQITFIFLLISLSNGFSQNAGDVSPNAKILDVDQMYSFSEGFAVVTKGSEDALIKPDGSFFIPFHKYTFFEGSIYAPDSKGNYFDFPKKGFANGFAPVKPIGRGDKSFNAIFINTQGKEVFPINYGTWSPFVNGKADVYIPGDSNNDGYFLLTNGTLIPIEGSSWAWFVRKKQTQI